MHKGRFNVLLEIAALVAFLGALVFFVILGVFLFTVVGIEMTAGAPEPSRAEETVQNPAGYLFSILVFALPLTFLIFTAIGIRWFLVRPEPHPWIDFEEETSR